MIFTTDESVCIFCLVECENTICENRFGCDCKVTYHEECMDGWIQIKNVCPICKTNVFLIQDSDNVSENIQRIRMLDCGITIISIGVTCIMGIIITAMIYVGCMNCVSDYYVI